MCKWAARAWLGDQPALQGAQARIIMERLAGHLWAANERREWLGAWLLTSVWHGSIRGLLRPLEAWPLCETGGKAAEEC